VACLAAPVAYLAIVPTPSMNGMVSNGNLSSMSSFAFEVRGIVYIMINVVTDTGYGVGSSKVFGAVVYGKVFSLKGLLEGSDTTGDLSSL